MIFNIINPGFFQRQTISVSPYVIHFKVAILFDYFLLKIAVKYLTILLQLNILNADMILHQIRGSRNDFTLLQNIFLLFVRQVNSVDN